MKDENAELYFDREPTQIKHEVLKKYLERFAHIVGRWANGLIYVDAFSGPWNCASADFRDSSFAIALGELRKARETARQAFEKELSLACIFLEKDQRAFAQLQKFTGQQNDVEITALNLEYEQAA